MIGLSLVGAALASGVPTAVELAELIVGDMCGRQPEIYCNPQPSFRSATFKQLRCVNKAKSPRTIEAVVQCQHEGGFLKLRDGTIRGFSAQKQRLRLYPDIGDSGPVWERDGFLVQPTFFVVRDDKARR